MADDLFLKIAYQGDVARVYADGLLVEDNFWNGNPMMVRVSDLVGKQVELKILPLPQNDLIYLQAPYRDILKKSSGPLLNLEGITMVERCTFLDSNVWYFRENVVILYGKRIQSNIKNI